MTESKSIICYIFKWVKMLRIEYSDFIKEVFYSDGNPPIKPVVKALFIFPFLLFISFSFIVGLIVLVSGLIFINCKEFIKSIVVNETSVQSSLTSTVFNENILRELLCEVLRDNAVPLEIIAPKNVSDITPTEYTPLQMVNNIVFARFIVQCSGCDCDDFDTLLALLNSKLSQLLQEKYPDYCLMYRDLKLVTVFNISYDLYHSGFYNIDIMVVDNETKYQYLQSLNRNKRNARTTTVISNLKDKDF